jgi:predicted permease
MRNNRYPDGGILRPIDMILWSDCRFAIRQLRKSPGFTLTVLATLGLCIGANTAIYSVLDAVLLRAVPYPQPERLAVVASVQLSNGKQELDTSQAGMQFETVRDGARAIDVAAWAPYNGANFAGLGHLEYVQQQRVSTGYFRVLGVPPQYGREFAPAEDVAGGAAVAVLSYDFWQRIFHGDAGALGRAINLRGEPYTVIGIMPRQFRSDAPIDVWTPLRPSRTGEGSGNNYGVIARLRPGVNWAEASEQVKALSRGIFESPAFPYSRNTIGFEERLIPLQKGFTDDSRTELLLTWGAVLVVLLIGCVNIAGLLLARSAARSREIATRLALGGGRGAIVRQLLVESLVLALGGCIVGVGLGLFAIRWLKQLGADRFELWHPIALDARVLAAMFAIAVVTSVLFGLAPAVSTSRLDIRAVLVEGGRGVAGTRRRWPRHALVAAEVALSLVLLVGAGLMVRTLAYLNGLNPGFDPHNVITAQASLQDARYQTAKAVSRLYAGSLAQIRRIPGVDSAAVALTLPYERPLNYGVGVLDGTMADKRSWSREVVYVTPGYFETMRIPILQGNAIRDADTAESAKVAMVSQSFARKFFVNGDAVGHHVSLDRIPREIIGIVGDVEQHSGLGDFGPLSIDPTVYVPVTQVSDGFVQVIHTWFPPKWVVRTNRPIGNLTAQLQNAVASVDPLLPLAKFRTIDQLQTGITSGQRYHAALFSILGGLALLLAAIGLYGLISQSITERTHELGVRMALGATVPQAVAAMVRPGVLLAAIGVAAGYVLSRIAVKWMEHMVWGVRPTDPMTFVGAAAILLLVAVVASLVPARRILRLDPAETLRDQ